MEITITTLQKEDYYNGYLSLLKQLTTVGDISYADFCKKYDEMVNHVNIFVMREKDKIIGSGTIYYEPKFIHNLSYVGHIEDIVIHQDYRGKGLGKYLLNFLENESKNNGCYKIILDCSKNNAEFYKKCGFINKGVQMAKYY